MVHKPTAISVIAPVTVAGILIMAILATILSINQGFAQEKKPTELTLNLSPLNNSITRTHEVTGRLTSEGSGVGGAAITVEVPGYGRLEDTTNNDGGYSSTFHLGPGKDTIKVEFSGNSEYEPSSKTQVYTVAGSQPDKPTELTLNVSPATLNASLPATYDVTGRLTSEGSGVGGATIAFQTIYIGFYVGPRLSNAVTHSDGTYSETMVTKAINSATGGTKPAPIRVLAGYSGDDRYMASSSKMFTIR